MNKTKLEEEHYDKKATSLDPLDPSFKISNNDKVLQSANKCYEDIVKNYLAEKKAGFLLDYGCGSGFRNFKFASDKFHLTGIDISSKSIEIANKIRTDQKINAEYFVMDCEHTNFPNEHFDIILDYGSFSSLEITKAIPELVRILKTDGILICIETFGHHPIANLKRVINVLRGRRTKWAAAHIMRSNDWKFIKSRFNENKFYYFGLFSLLLAPFFKILPNSTHSFFIKIFEKIDTLYFYIPIFKRYAFKTVSVFSKKI